MNAPWEWVGNGCGAILRGHFKTSGARGAKGDSALTLGAFRLPE
jgi:hypothetical protein